MFLYFICDAPITYSDMYKYIGFVLLMPSTYQNSVALTEKKKKKVKATYTTYIKEACNIGIIFITMLDNKIQDQLIVVCNSVLHLYFCYQI